ncbi:MAG: metal ABC transporter permease [Actinomycetota bacterium]
MSFLTYDWMVRALIAGAVVGLAAPAIGVFIVQRRLALMGDGIGHVAFTGIAAGLLMNVAPVLTALAFAVIGAVVIELLRERSRTSGDVALALVFYGGIAGGVLLISIGDIAGVNLYGYLFGSVLSVGTDDLSLVIGVAAAVLVVTTVLRSALFAVAYDDEVARVSGLPVRALNISSAVIAAVTIAITSKVVGILLVSSMLVLPVAAVQQLTRSFRSTVLASLAMGVVATTGGLVIAYYADVAPAASIVLLAIGAFIVAALVRRVALR